MPVPAERNRAFERLFDIVLAALLIGSVALTLFASRLTARIRTLRDDAEAAIDAHGRVKGALSGSRAGDEIGDLSRSFSSVLARLSQYAGYQAEHGEPAVPRAAHADRRRALVARQSRPAAVAGGGAHLHRACVGWPDPPRRDPCPDDRKHLPRAEPRRRRAGANRSGGACQCLCRRLPRRLSAARAGMGRAAGRTGHRRRAGSHRAVAGQARRERRRVRAPEACRQPFAWRALAGARGSPWRTTARRFPRAWQAGCWIGWCRCDARRAATSRTSGSDSTSCA